ncbi:immunity 53 family protein [Pendulispora albinea]|uniref:Immunity 53 family protein n=1 Tax=Pendulispora albinea TaxID=2741071 RepID=A0ABZ2M7Y3_9BACT
MKTHEPSETDLLTRLEKWYLNECNEDWEHSFGVKIDTLDNPGWRVTIDLSDTRWADLEIVKQIDERTERDWIQIEVTKAQFVGCGGPRNLREILSRFFSIVESGEHEVNS